MKDITPVLLGLIILVILFAVSSWHQPARWQYLGIEAEITYTDTNVSKDTIFEFIGNNSNLTTKDVHPFGQFKFSNQSYTTNEYWFRIINYTNLTIKFRYYSKVIESTNKTKIYDPSEEQFLIDKQISVNLTGKMIEEFKILTKKDPKPIIYSKVIEPLIL